MQPQSGADEPSPVAGITIGMSVVDSTGTPAGAVSAVQAPGTGVRPDTQVGVAEHLMGSGYLRIDGTGYLSNDTYAAGDQISGVSSREAEVVELRVPCEELHRAAS